jgi:uncharacterized membrane protein YqiK
MKHDRRKVEAEVVAEAVVGKAEAAADAADKAAEAIAVVAAEDMSEAADAIDSVAECLHAKEARRARSSFFCTWKFPGSLRRFECDSRI